MTTTSVSVKETCACGATFDYVGSYTSDAQNAAAKFREGHRHESPPAPDSEPQSPADIDSHTGFHVADHTGYLLNSTEDA
jgi:hypothetical protein